MRLRAALHLDVHAYAPAGDLLRALRSDPGVFVTRLATAAVRPAAGADA